MIDTPQILFRGDLLSVTFDSFNLESYRLFLKMKRLPEFSVEFDDATAFYTVTAPARFATMLGLPAPIPERPPLPLSDFLFDDQKAIVGLALAAKRFAVWSDCGLGKTPIALEYARQVLHITGGRGLILTLNEIVPQFAAEAKRFYGDALPIRILESREEMKAWCRGEIDGPERIAITNYEKMNPDDEGQVVNEIRLLSFLILDESSRLKTGGGKQKWAIIHSGKGIPYKLSLTATPAPNDTMEFASQASFLERMRNEEEIIWTYFVRDPKSHRWTLKKNARAAFFEWMAAWSIYVKNPKRYGWRLTLPEIPDPILFEHILPVTPAQREYLFVANNDDDQLRMFGDKGLNMIQRSKQSQAAKGFIYLADDESEDVRYIDSVKPRFVAELIAAERRHGLQVIVWTVFDEETRLLAKEIGNLPCHVRPLADEVAILTGSTSKAKRAEIIAAYLRGDIRVLISRASVLGYGMNMQCCGSMIFNGWNDSFEQFYQALRRAFRFGQEKALRVHVPVIPELEGQTLANIRRKQEQFDRDIEEMEINYIKAFGDTGLLMLERGAA